MAKAKENKREDEGAETQAQPDAYHIPVMLHEAIDALAIKPEGVYVDCTMGGGGHTRKILKDLGPNGKLIAFDQDADAEKNAPKDERVIFVPHNFRHLQRFLRLHGVPKVDGVLADLGVSSHQFDEGSRGFSFRFEADLDMRMDQRQGQTAADVVNSFSAEKMQSMFSNYGEVTNAKTLAQSIVQARQTSPIKTINDLANILQSLAKGNPNKYFAQVFQALRIEVNAEMEALKEMLDQLPKVLKAGGRAAIITFHSLEDRMVKNFFKEGSFEKVEDPIYGNRNVSPFEIITKKPIEASAEELKINPRSRSARLRVAEMK